MAFRLDLGSDLYKEKNMSVTRQQVAELYVATFNRAPDAAGLDYWVNDSGLTIEQIAQSFFDQTETKTLYPEGTSDEAFVTSIYTNLFNRAPDALGLTYWLGADGLGGGMTRDVMIEAMKNGATGTDATIIANKATVGLAFADAGLEGTDFSLASVTEVTSTLTAAELAVATAAYDAAVAHVAEVQNNPAATIADLNAANAAVTTTAAAVVTAQEANTAALATEAAAAAAAAEAADVATYDAAVVAYDAAVTTAAASKAAADTAAADVSTLAKAQASLTAATTADTDAAAVVTAAAALTAAAANTDATTDDTTAAASAATAADAKTAADAVLATAQTAVNNLTEQTFTVAAATASVTEGNAIVFTVTADHARNVDTIVKYQIQGVTTTAAAAATPLTDLGILNGEVTIKAGETTGTITLTPSSDNSTEGYEAFKVTLLNSDLSAANSSGTVTISDPVNAGQAFTLTTGVDDFEGGAGDDTYTGTVNDDGTTVANTFSALDNLDGGAGTDVLNLNVIDDNTTGFPAATVTNIETLNLRTAVALTEDVSSFTGLLTANVTQAGDDLALTAATTTDIVVSSASAAIILDGGKNITITESATANENITIGATTVNAGTITVTDSKQGTGAIAIDGGTTVSVTATATEATGAITVGDTTNAAAGVAVATDVATGAISITQNLVGDGTGIFTGGAIKTEGGSTVSITVNANSTATSATTNDDITVGQINVNGSDDTTTVTVTQNDNAATFTSAAVAGISETETITFLAMASGEDVTVNGLTFTAAKDLTAAEAAAAFANLIATTTDKQSATGITANGIYTGTFNTAAWTSGAASGATVTFTEVTASTGDNNMVVADNIAAGNIATVEGVTGLTAVTAATSSNTTIFGKVVIADAGDDSIATVTVDGYADASTIASDVLTSLTLRNNTDAADITVTNTTAASTLALTLDDITSAGAEAVVSLDGSASKYTTLNITTEGSASSIGLVASGAKNLTVDAGVALNITGSSTNVTALETVDVNGAGAVNLGNISTSVALDSFDASGNTGGVTATVETDDTTLTGDITEYKFSEGADTATLIATAGTVMQTKVTLGAGDDMADLSTGDIATLSEMIDGGTGTNTIKLTAAVAESASANNTFEGNITNFSKLSIAAASSQEVVNMANMDDINYVIAAASTAGAAQVNTVTIANTVEAGDIFTTTINGTEYSFTATAATTANVSAGLVAAINADTNCLVTATDTTDEFTLTADTAGIPFTVSVATTEAGGGTSDSQTITNAATTANTYGLALDNMATNGTLELTDDGTYDVDLTDATPTTDVFNIEVSLDTDGSDITAFLDLADIETLNITADDSSVDTAIGDTVDNAVLTLLANEAKTITIDGSGDVDLTFHMLTDEVTTVNASELDGVLTVTANSGTAAMTITGGSADDSLTASGASDILIGGAGDDTLTGASLTTLTGGEGNDTFVMATVASVNQFSNISDLTAGDVIKTTAANEFLSEKYSAIGANLADYVDLVINNTDANQTSWFNLTVDGTAYTFIVDNQSNSTTGFDESQDQLIAIVGTKDLSTDASYNQTAGTIEIA